MGCGNNRIQVAEGQILPLLWNDVWLARNPSNRFLISSAYHELHRKIGHTLVLPVYKSSYMYTVKLLSVHFIQVENVHHVHTGLLSYKINLSEGAKVLCHTHWASNQEQFYTWQNNNNSFHKALLLISAYSKSQKLTPAFKIKLYILSASLSQTTMQVELTT